MANFADLWEQTPIDKTGGLQGDFANRIQAANQAWMAKTGKPLPINSGARTAEEGIKLWGQRASNPNLVAKPGTSLHERGAAADIPVDVPDSFLAEYGLHRPFGKKDPVHVEANPSYVPKQTATKPTAETGNFADLWDATPASATGTVEKPKTMKEAMTSAQSTYKPLVAGAASLGDVILGAVPAIAGQATYAGARAFQKSPEEAQALAQKVSEPLTNPLGKALGVTQEPAYQNEATRRAMNAIGQYIGESADSISQKTGIPKADVENMIQTLTLAAPEVAGRVKSAAPQLKAQFEKSFPRFEEPIAKAPSGAQMTGVGAADASIQNRVQTALNEAPEYLKQSLKDVPLDKLATEENLKAIENHNKFAKFDLIPTEGQALQDASLMSREFNDRKIDPNLQARFEERDPKLIEGFNKIKEAVAPDVFENDPIRLASMSLDKLKNDYVTEQAKIRTLYDKANRAAGGSQAPIDIGALQENIINGLREKHRTRYVPERLKADLDEVLAQGYMTPEQYENFRTDTATIARTARDPMEAQAASIIREKLEQVPIKDEFAQYKPLYDEARKAVAELKAKEKIPAYKAAISDTRTLDEIEAGIPHPAANNFVANHYSAKTPQVNIERMLDLIGRDSLEHQALNKLKIDEFKLGSGIKNDRGTVSQNALNKIIYEQNKSNLPVMFGNKFAKDLQDLADVAHLTEPRKGVHSVNVSNTEILRQENEAIKAAKEASGNIAAGGAEAIINTQIPFGGTILRKTLGGMKAAREAKALAKEQQAQSEKRLSPKAGIKLKDIGKE